MTPEQDLIAKGIEVIERDGWYQGGLYAKPSRKCGEAALDEAARSAAVCIIGSLYRALDGTCATADGMGWPGENHPVAKACKVLETAITDAASVFPHPYAGIISQYYAGIVSQYNDAPTTTKEDVILMMKRAACE